MKKKYPDLELPLEKSKSFEEIESKDVIRMAMDHQDPLCCKVVDKFVEIFGTEVGNAALFYLPFGGIYLIGGVTGGIQDHLSSNPIFLNNFLNKGRLSSVMHNFNVYVVNS